MRVYPLVGEIEPDIRYEVDTQGVMGTEENPERLAVMPGRTAECW